MNDYYVYCYWDGDVPIYIGAGRGRRDVRHGRSSERGCRYFCWRLCRIRQEGRKSSMCHLLDNLTRQESRRWERFFIAAIGREDLQTGPLCNLTGGGDGVTNVSIATRQRMSASRKAVMMQPEMKERYSKAIKAASARPEVKQRQSEAAKVALARPGVKQQRIAAQHAASIRPDVKLRRSMAQKVAHNRPEVKQHQSEAAKAVSARPEVKQRRSEAAKAANRYKPPKGRFKGVFPKRKKWFARIDRQYFGTFGSPELAAQAYNDGVDKYWGGDGYKNQIPVVEKQ